MMSDSNVTTDLRENDLPERWVPLPSVHIGGFDIATASRDQLTLAMLGDCRAWRATGTPASPRLIFDANGHALSLRETDRDYREAVSQGDVIHADGGFLVTLSRLKERQIAERSAGTDMIHDFAQKAVEEGLSFYLLGGTEAVNAKCTEQLQANYPGLRIAGRRHGYFSEEEEPEVIEEINRARPDILWVGLGKPKEQIFSVKWKPHLRACWLVTCGGCYNYITGVRCQSFSES